MLSYTTSRPPGPARGARRAVVPAAKKPGLRKWRAKKLGLKQQPLSDAELMRELNDSNDWMLASEQEEGGFGLEDVEAYAKQESGDAAFPPPPGGRANPGKRAKSAGAAAAGNGGGDLERELAAAAAAAAAGRDGDVPAWIKQLQAEGFALSVRGGEVFLQRGSGGGGGGGDGAKAPRAAAPQGTGPAASSQQQRRPAAGGGGGGEPAQQGGQQQAGADVGAAACAVGPEFDLSRWLPALEARAGGPAATRGPGAAQRSFEDGDDSAAEEGGGGPFLNGAADGDSGPLGGGEAWWLGPDAAAGPGSQQAAHSRKQQQRKAAQAQQQQQRQQQPQPGDRSAAAARVRAALSGCATPEQVLRVAEAAFPEWAANNGRIVHQARFAPVDAPGPAEAALLLKSAALAARRRRLNQVQMLSLARDWRVRGLAEALRATPPRLEEGAPPALSRRVWDAAKAYWRPPDEADVAAAAAAVVGAPEPQPPQQQPGAHTGPNGTANGAPVNGAANGAPANGAPAGGAANGIPAAGGLASLVARVKEGGLRLTPAQVAAARRLLELREAERQRRAALVDGVWALSAIGGPWLFEAEVDALMQARLDFERLWVIAGPSLASWPLTGREAADLLWALANARHWTPLLPRLEAAVLRAGGPRALGPPQLAAVLWAFATLGHAPEALLEGLARGWGTKRGGGLRALQPGQLATVAWSLAAMGRARSEAFRLAWAEVLQRGEGAAGVKHHLVQIWQAALEARLEGGDSGGGGGSGGGGSGGGGGAGSAAGEDAGAQSLLAAAEAAFASEAASLKGRSHSSYQRAIANALTGARVMHVMEDSSSGYSIDVSIPSLRVAIEADGPSHLSRNKGPGGAPVRLGATRMKARHLRAMGWRVVNVAFSEWDATPQAARHAFLQARIAAAR
ncbi:hypothetical protein Rsub_11011 [Raphidocelis subcapitata]|uniref:RAP domain-containing protein n=1 Tax=Raphidocelis subcapitata TaxID=307507 RepID=A0A2V0PBY9_9CHLO|nr:hypothetical protein Rsub_11011 [Raphidocelis subcapitata]|eukprot:GBF97364.1 hypothetical protein Rsub_11011 [Raphidocelis subcapitata]